MKIQEFVDLWIDKDLYAIRLQVTHSDLDGIGCAVGANYTPSFEKVCPVHAVDPFHVPAVYDFYRTPSSSMFGEVYTRTNILIADHAYMERIEDTITHILEISKSAEDIPVLIAVTDFSLRDDFVRDITSKYRNLCMIIIDHHQTCPEYGDYINFAYIKDTTHCGTYLVYKTFLSTVDSFAEAVNKYDLGNFGAWQVESFNDVPIGTVLNIIYSEIKAATQTISDENYSVRLITMMSIANNMTDVELVDNQRLVGIAMVTLEDEWNTWTMDVDDIVENVLNNWRTLKRQRSSYIRNMIPINLNGSSSNKYGVFVCPQGNGFFMIAKSILEEYTDIPYMVGFFPNRMSFSIAVANTHDFNAGYIAKKNGGGGHPGAAGFAADEIQFTTTNGMVQKVRANRLVRDDVDYEETHMMNIITSIQKHEREKNDG